MFPTTISPEYLLLATSALLACAMLPTSFRAQILLYQLLSGVLAALTLWTALADDIGWSILLIVIPVGLAVFIRRIARYIAGPATIEPLPLWQQITWSLLGLSLIALAFAVTPLLPMHGGESNGLRLATALALALIGIGTWLVRKDLISQAIGLLVMDDALLLSAESAVYHMALTLTLLVVLFIYLLVPLTCLLLVMPQLRRSAPGLDVDQLKELRG